MTSMPIIDNTTVLSLMDDRPLSEKFQTLPFVKSRKREGLQFWAIPSSGSYATDCNMGIAMAGEYFRFTQRVGATGLFKLMILDMMEHGAGRGHIVGLCDVVESTLMQALDIPRAQI